VSLPPGNRDGGEKGVDACRSIDEYNFKCLTFGPEQASVDHHCVRSDHHEELEK
jgi:hypothetical protein